MPHSEQEPNIFSYLESSVDTSSEKRVSAAAYLNLAAEAADLLPPTPDHIERLSDQGETRSYKSLDSGAEIRVYDDPVVISFSLGELHVSYEEAQNTIFLRLTPELTLSFRDLNAQLPAEVYELFPETADEPAFQVSLQPHLPVGAYFDGDSQDPDPTRAQFTGSELAEGATFPTDTSLDLKGYFEAAQAFRTVAPQLIQQL